MRAVLRALRALYVTGALTGLLLVVLAAPASAHTEVTRTQPSSGAVLAKAPNAVVLSFSGEVSRRFATVVVTGPDGGRADQLPLRFTRSTVTAGLRSGASAGTYTVIWRVVSDDNHPISGRFAFVVGAPTPSTPAAMAAVAQAVAASTVPTSTRALLGVSRLVEYGGFLLLAGVVLLVAWAWPAGALTRRVRVLAWAGWGAVVAGTMGTLLMQGPDVLAAGPLAAFTEPGLLSDVLVERFGQLHIARLAALLAVTPGLALSWASAARSSTRRGLGALAWVGFLAATWSLAGHAGTRSPVAVSVLVDAVHLVAVAAWLGGLVVVATALLRAADVDLEVARWSRLAFASVVALTVTGSWSAVAQVGSWRALTGTEYGQLLVAKVTLVAVMVVLGGVARARLRRRGPSGLRAGVRVEAAVGVGVLVLASLLVATAPARVMDDRPAVSDAR